MKATLVVLLLFVGALAPVSRSDTRESRECGAAITWKGRGVDLSALPADLPEDTGEALRTWHEWASAADARMDIETSGRVLLVAHRSVSGVAKFMAGIQAALARLDKLVPRLSDPSTPPRSSAGAPKAPDDVLPEDPEDAPGAERGSRQRRQGGVVEWGTHTRPLDRGTIVVFLLRDGADLARLADRLVELSPELSTWRAGCAGQAGFALESLLVGAVVLGGAGQEEFDADNEVVHRVAELALLRRAGHQPYWLVQGWAWQAEFAVRRSVYCFPYRSEFVAASEHSGWDRALSAMWKKQEQSLSYAHLTKLERGAYDDRAAKLAWGLIAHVERTHPQALRGILDDLRETWERGSRRDLGAGRWERDPAWVVPLEDLARIFELRLGSTFLVDLQRSFARGLEASPRR